MTVFPSAHERSITIAIVSFLIGAAVAAISVANATVLTTLVTASFTLIAAFFGAWSAFRLEAASRARSVREIQLEAANKLLFALLERLNILSVFRIDTIEPVRHSNARMIQMKPVINIRPPESTLSVQEISFLFQSKHRGLLLKLGLANDAFNGALDAIAYRSEIHLNTFQPLLERAGFVQGEAVSDLDVREAIGDRNFHNLKNATDTVIAQVDKAISGGDQLREELISAFVERFSEGEVLRFEITDEVKNAYRDPGETSAGSVT